MKKSLLTTRASSRRNSSIKRVRIVLMVLILALVLGYAAPKVTTWLAGVALQPVVLVERWARTSQAMVPRFVRTRTALIAERNELADELMQTQAALESTRALSGQVGGTIVWPVDAENSSTTVQAHVIAQPPAVPYDRLVLNQGSRAGVVEGAPVFLGDTVIIGTVLAVTPNQSIATLISSPDVESTVFIFGPDIYTTAVGQGGGVLRIGVPQGIPLAIGNAVTVPAAGQGVVGAIASIEAEATRPEQYAYVTLPIGLQQLQTVSIGRTPLTPRSFEEARSVVESVRTQYFTVPVPEGVLVDIPESGATSTTATSTATSTNTDV